jgi:hypothetical protein
MVTVREEDGMSLREKNSVSCGQSHQEGAAATRRQEEASITDQKCVPLQPVNVYYNTKT